MPRRRAVGELMLIMARLAVGIVMLWMAPVSFAEQAVTVYKDPT